MGNVKAYKYLASFTLPLVVAFSFSIHGWLTFSTLIYAFVLIPGVEMLVGTNPSNITALQREAMRKDPLFDFFIYLTVPVQVACLIWFLFEMKSVDNSSVDIAGKVSAMGIMCGVFGINVAHELGHRTKSWERLLAKVMLCTSLYMHFFIEHNRGHHRNVGTMEDPATARKNEIIYFYWLRTIFFSVLSAWRIVKKERERKKLSVISFGNEFIQYLLIETILCIVIWWFFGATILSYFLFAAVIGMLLLETVNYIEHYGLFRNKVSEFRYEDVEPKHSWNSDFIIGRLVLFELTRHSDHHWEPSKHYQYLDSMKGASQLPAGYPSMMLLALFPPLWFAIMNPRIGSDKQNLTGNNP